jgi:hypothetical protein
MRIIVSFCFSIMLIAFSCTKEIPDPAEDIHNIDIGSYTLLPSSIDKIPYLGKKAIVFVDSNFNEIVFEIIEFPVSQLYRVTSYRYNVYSPGDTVTYHYLTQSKSFSFIQDSLKIEFNLILGAMPYYSEPKSEYVADVLNIWMKDPNVAFTRRQVFSHVTNQRTWPEIWINEWSSEKVILNRIFYDVFRNVFSNPLSKVHFNYEYGIVSFTDFSGKLWRFERFM